MKSVLIFKHISEDNGQAIKTFFVLFTRASEHSAGQEETDLKHLRMSSNSTACTGTGNDIVWLGKFPVEFC